MAVLITIILAGVICLIEMLQCTKSFENTTLIVVLKRKTKCIKRVTQYAGAHITTIKNWPVEGRHHSTDWLGDGKGGKKY